jgi:hypothetical protein
MKESKGKPKKVKPKTNASNPSVKNLIDKAAAGSKQSK